MNPALRLSMVLSICFCAVAQQNGSLRGLVVNSSTGEPLRGVHVRLLVPSRGGFSAAYGAMSDESGHFSIASLPSGAYLLDPDLFGFYFVPSPNDGAPQRSVVIQPGQALTEFRIEMAPRAILSGHILDEKGLPLESATLDLQPAVPGDLGLEMALELRNKRWIRFHNERGEFHFSVPPGKYYLSVLGGSSGEDIQPDGLLVARTFRLTYFPGVTDQKSATVIEARGGQEITGLDIRVTGKPPLSVAGTVIGIPTGATAEVNIHRELSPETPNFRVAPDGSFIAKDLEQGIYYVYAVSSGDGERLRSPLREIEIGDSRIESLTLQSQALGRISGTVVPAAAAAAARNVRLEPLMEDSAPGADPARVGSIARGAFEIRDVEPERYRVTVFPQPENGYIRSILPDEAIVPERIVVHRFASDGEKSELLPVLDLHQGRRDLRLKIVIGDGAQISGKLIARQGSASHGFAFVILAPDGTTSEDAALRVPVGSDGSYAFHGLPPGKYRLFGADFLTSSPGQDFSFEKLSAKAAIFEVKEGDRITRNVDAESQNQ